MYPNSSIQAEKNSVIVTVYNNPDGIGDLWHGLDVYSLLKSKITRSISMTFLGFLDIKKWRSFQKSDHPLIPEITWLNLIDHLDGEGFLSIEPPPTINVGALYIGLIPEVLEGNTYNRLIARYAEFEKLLRGIGYWINMSIPFGSYSHPWEYPDNTMTIRESGSFKYRFLEEEQGYFGFFKERFDCLTLRMDISEHDTGYKFNPKQQMLILSDENRLQGIHEMQNKTLRDLIFSEKPLSLHQVPFFLKETPLLVGYSQNASFSKAALEIFVHAFSAEKMIAVINCDHFDLDKLDESLDHIGHIEFYSISTNVQRKIRDRQNGIHLILIDFNGIKDHDKLVLQAMAALVIGSGDNSRSEAILSRLPLFNIMSWKWADSHYFIEFIKNNCSAPELVEYFSLCHELSLVGNYNLIQKKSVECIVEILKTKQDVLIEQWADLRRQLLSQHHFNTFLDKLVSVIQAKDAFKDHFKSIPEGFLLEKSEKFFGNFFNQQVPIINKIYEQVDQYIRQDDALPLLQLMNTFKYSSYNFYFADEGVSKEESKPALLKCILFGALQCFLTLLSQGVDTRLTQSFLDTELAHSILVRSNKLKLDGKKYPLLEVLKKWCSVIKYYPRANIINILKADGWEITLEAQKVAFLPSSVSDNDADNSLGSLSTRIIKALDLYWIPCMRIELESQTEQVLPLRQDLKKSIPVLPKLIFVVEAHDFIGAKILNQLIPKLKEAGYDTFYEEMEPSFTLNSSIQLLVKHLDGLQERLQEFHEVLKNQGDIFSDINLFKLYFERIPEFCQYSCLEARILDLMFDALYLCYKEDFHFCQIIAANHLSYMGIDDKEGRQLYFDAMNRDINSDTSSFDLKRNNAMASAYLQSEKPVCGRITYNHLSAIQQILVTELSLERAKEEYCFVHIHCMAPERRFYKLIEKAGIVSSAAFSGLNPLIAKEDLVEFSEKVSLGIVPLSLPLYMYDANQLNHETIIEKVLALIKGQNKVQIKRGSMQACTEAGAALKHHGLFSVKGFSGPEAILMGAHCSSSSNCND